MELNYLEFEFLQMINFSLFVSLIEFQAMENLYH